MLQVIKVRRTRQVIFSCWRSSCLWPAYCSLLCSAADTRNASLLCSCRSGLVVAVAILADVSRSGEALTYVLGGWQPPLGVALRADGLSAAMLVDHRARDRRHGAVRARRLPRRRRA